MTIEETALAVNKQQIPGENGDYAKIREFTGKNSQDIHKAIKACENKDGDYEIADVINWLISKDTPQKTQPEQTGSAVVAQPTSDLSDLIPANIDPEDKPGFIGPKNKPTTGSSVIDLTSEVAENEDIQRAFAASLRDNQGILGGQISREEQDISRVLEQSLLEESKAGTKRKRGDIWFVDPLNPHERKRDAEWPVGLKNVGNTCWFSAVVQSLFHLPKFRQLVLAFMPPSDISSGNSTERRNLHFMHELRRLFALMVLSKKKYVDPSRAVEILKEAFTTGPSTCDSQQDVSEFQHKLLEWLEDAFRSDQSRPPSPANGVSSSNQGNQVTTATEVETSSNPMMQLFYGQYLAEGMNEGKSFTNKETFGQFPLQVDGFRDIHESLDGATAQGEIETVSQEITSESGQELWFTCLPAVMTFELSRFQFNQALGRPEKIHNRFSFPEVIYMDRYMECNKCITRQKREEVKKLKERLTHLQRKLDKFINYGSGTKRVPLQDVLQYALEFAESRGVPQTTEGLCPSPLHDVEMESPKSCVSMVTESPVGTPTKPEPPAPPLVAPSPESMETSTKSPSVSPKKQPSPAKDIVTETAPATHTSCYPSSTPPVQTSIVVSSCQPPIMTTPSHGYSSSHDNAGPAPHQLPSPRNVSNEELGVLQVCLRRWRREVEQDVKELQDNINQLEKTMNSMYTQPSLTKCPYRLHAVLVHEGQAASGHYWAYVHCSKYNTWLKFNDITVTEASWEELVREGAGGHHNTSAYCLMYVDPARVSALAVDAETGQPEASDTDSLPTDLLKYVNIDNDKFEREIEDWDAEQRRKASKSLLDSELPSTSKSSQTTQTASSVLLAPRKQDTATIHAQLAIRQTYELVMKTIESKTSLERGSECGLHEACKQEVERLSRLAQTVTLQLPAHDPRLHHMLVYLLANGITSENVIKRVLLEPFVQMPNVDQDESARRVRSIALKELESVKKEVKLLDETTYEMWHTQYYQYRKTIFAFISGLNHFHGERYVDSLPYLTFACDLNQTLICDGGPVRGMDARLLGYYHRQCLLHVNEAMSVRCEKEDDISDYLDVMTKLVLPCLTFLAGSDSPQDTATVEEIRSRWCKFLSLEMSKSKLNRLQDFLSRLFDTPTEVKSLLTSLVLKFNSGSELEDEYDNAMIKAKEAGCLEAMGS